MKKILTALAILALVLAACGDGGNSTGNEDVKTTLTIKNSSDYNSLEILYGTVSFGIVARGTEVTKEVNDGTRYISILFYYYLDYGSGERLLRVNEAITCEEGKKNQFTINNNTIVTIDGGFTGFDKQETGSLKNVIETFLNYYREQQ